MFRITIIEDDQKIVDIVSNHLRRYGFEAWHFTNYSNVAQQMTKSEAHLVILDINLPQYDGFFLCRQIRAVSRVPIIFLSARDSAMDQVFALENGGDDYITKPFHLEVLLAKVQSLLRRTYGEYSVETQNAALAAGNLLLSEERQVASHNERQVELTVTEFRLLRCLMRKCNCVVSREELLEALWDDTSFVDDNTLSVNVARVRKKLEELGLAHAIETRRGQGYRLVVGE